MKKIIWILFIFMVMIGIAEGQRGGGRSSGGRSSGGSSSRSSSYSSRSGYSYSRTYTCAEQCFGNPNQNCIMNCQNSKSTSGIIVGSIFGSFCVCGATIFACLKCECCRIPKWCPCHKYQKLKRQYNQVDQNSMSQEQFISKRDRIIGLINNSETAQNFKLEQGIQKYPMTAQAQIVKQDKFKVELNIHGSDHFGQWTANGFILCRNGQIFFWMYKQYLDKQAAGQTDQWQHLVYESKIYDDYNGIQGKWFYVGYQYSAQYSGQWRLIAENSPSQNYYEPTVINSTKFY